MIILAATMMLGGLFACRTLNIEAYPDYGLTLRQVLDGLNNANINVIGGTLLAPLLLLTVLPAAIGLFSRRHAPRAAPAGAVPEPS